MPIYQYNVYDGCDVGDIASAEFSDIKLCRSDAIKFAGAIIEDEGATFPVGERWRMDVTDAAGKALLQIEFKVTDVSTSKSPGKA